MKHTTYNNRRIFWESKSSQIVVILISFLFVAIAIWIKDKTSPLIFWATIVFFGGGGIFMLIRLINPNNLFVTHDSELGQQILSEQYHTNYKDLGFFSYNNEGFTVIEQKGLTHHNWSDIETIFGFKEDQLTIDEICMDIFFSNKTGIRLTESMPGWAHFNKRLSQAIPTVSEDWEFRVMHPAFAANMTLLFDKDDRRLDQAVKAYYGQNDR